jgi:hypothetical protein
MTETKHPFRVLDDIGAPDLWERIESRAPREDDPEPARPMWKRAVPVAIAAMITAAIVLVLSSAFRPDNTAIPVVPSVPTIGPVQDVSLGTPRVLPIARAGDFISSAREAFGSLWTIESLSGVEQLQRRNVGTGEIEKTFSPPVYGGGEWGGDGIEIGAGYVWVRAWDTATVYSIDPETEGVQRFPLNGKVVSDLAIDAQGQVWASVSMKGGEVEVVRLDPATGQVTQVKSFEPDWWGGLYVIDGAVWTLERRVEGATVKGGTLTQIIPGTAPSVDVGGSFALPVTDGASLWTPFFGDRTAMNLSSGIARVDPATGEVLDEWETGSVGYDLTVGADGGVWFLAGQHLQRLNPATGRVDVKATVEGTPIFLTPADDGMWVETYEGDLVFFPFTGRSEEEVVPDVIGLASDQALQALDAASLKWIVAYREIDEAQLSHVASTDPVAGTFVDVGSTVRVVVATRITALPDQAIASLACEATETVAFGGPRQVLLPAGETFIRANVPGIERSDKVVRATERDIDEGLWNIVRDDAIIAVIDYGTLDGAACQGSGVAAA